MKPGALSALLEPKALAFLGASDRLNSSGSFLIRNSRAAGFAGRLFPVNPRLSVIDGETCYPDLAALPETVDHVAIGLANDKLEAALEAVIAHGARAATIFASCLVDEPEGPRLAERLTAMAREAGLALCGGNTMGVYNYESGLRVCAFPSPTGVPAGGVAFIAQSGSVFGALAHNDRRLRFALSVSSGAEFVTTAADYLAWAIERPHVKVAALFLETVRAPETFAAALARAQEKDIPVIVLKVGRSPAAAAMARSHTGALAGNDAAYDALFRRYGVIRVRTLDEMAAVILLLQDGRRPGPGGLATMHDSGGEREMLTDLADDLGIAFAKIGEATKRRLAEHLDPGLEPMNPLDAWGSGRDFEEHMGACFEALLADPTVAVGVLSCDIRDNYFLSQAYARIAMKAFQSTDKPVAIAPNYAMVGHDKLVTELAADGVPVIDGSEEVLRAVGHVFAYRDGRALDRTPPAPADPAKVARWRRHLVGGGALDEATALALLADFGVPVPAHALVENAAELDAAAAQLGYPLALKTAAPGILHKSDVEGVQLGLHDAPTLAAAYHELAERLGPRALLARMVPRGVEIALGAVFDPQFGPCLMVAAGGTLVELLADRAFALAPVNRAEARSLLEGLSICKVLRGVRGQAPADLDALALVIERLSVLVWELRDQIAELDVNPVIAGPEGAVAVDCLLVPSDAADTSALRAAG